MGDNFFSERAPKPRSYQIDIALKAVKSNTLVVLPTGLGKTLIAALVINEYLGKGRVYLLAPTKPLAEQHRKTLLELMTLEEEDIVLITGEIPATKRKGVWRSGKIILATPQTLQNDIANKRTTLEGVSLVVFDEAHRCVGKYAYTYIAVSCGDRGIRVLGLTASPGADERKIRGITKTLGIDSVQIRDEEDEDVKEYMQPKNIKWIEVDLPEDMNALRNEMSGFIDERASVFQRMGLLRGTTRISKKKLIAIKHNIDSAKGGWKYTALSKYAELFNLIHAHELLETQGIGTFIDFFERMKERKEKSKAVERLLVDKRIENMLERAAALQTEHPKLKKLVEILKKNQGKSFIVFVQYRDQIRRVVAALSKVDGVKPIMFVGKGKGVTQKDQKKTVEMFRSNEYNVLVATQIGEEGLDIPSVDCVVFYEPVPSEIRSIQRRGRTGRTRAGEVIVLITRGTRDETYHWVSKRKENKMKRIMNKIQTETGRDNKKSGQTMIDDYL